MSYCLDMAGGSNGRRERGRWLAHRCFYMVMAGDDWWTDEWRTNPVVRGGVELSEWAGPVN